MEFILLVSSLIVSIIVIVLILLLYTRRPAGQSKLIEQATREEFRTAREESAKASRELREEIAAGQKTSTEALVKTISEMGKSQSENFELVAKRIKDLTESNEIRIERVRNTINDQLKSLQEGNEKKLDQMRQTVDEKLQNTLEKRLGESFKLVSERLELVHKGLGEMQNLAAGVGDLKKVLTNVKVRGIWGEAQLGSLLEQFLSPEQFEKNVATKRGGSERVEFAIKLPGKDKESDKPVYLAIDSKFPQEDYQKLLEAQEQANPELAEEYSKALEMRIKAEAREIRDKYINPPITTDFAIMFLPTESLFAEILRRPGVTDSIQRQYRVIVTGPTTCAALLNSLQIGFRTLAVEKRTSEIWKILGAVKNEFDKFGGVLSKVRKQLKTASNTIEDTEKRTTIMARKLREVEQLPETESAKLLELDSPQSTTPADNESES